MIDIADVKIDPQSEPRSVGLPSVTGQQELAADNLARQQFELTQNQQNLGWIGKFLASGRNAANSIAFIVLMVCLAAYIGSFFMPTTDELSHGRQGFLAVITLVIGYLFGSSSK